MVTKFDNTSLHFVYNLVRIRQSSKTNKQTNKKQKKNWVMMCKISAKTNFNQI